MYLTIQGLVLRVTAYNDTDALLSILTHSHGKLTVKARGLRRKNSPLTATCQLLAYSEFTLFEYRGMYTINEAHSLELFQLLRRDLQKLSLGTYFAQVAELVCQEDTPNSEHLSLVLNCLHALTKLNVDELQIKTVYELRCACLAGYTPELSACWRCGNTRPNRFDLSEGSTECASCRNISSEGIRMPISEGELDAMCYICTCNSKRLFAFRVGEQTLQRLSEISESYLLTQLERGFSTLDFYKTLLVNINTDT